MKIKSTLLNNCERQLQLNSQVSDCSWRCWIHRFQAAFLDKTIGSQHQLLFNICFAGTTLSICKLYPFYKSEVQLLLIFSNCHLLRLHSFDWTGSGGCCQQAVGVNSQTARSRNAWETCAIKWNHVISVLITWSPRRGDVGKHKIVGDFLKNRRAETWNSPLGEFIRVLLWGTSFLKTQWTKVFQTKN